MRLFGSNKTVDYYLNVSLKHVMTHDEHKTKQNKNKFRLAYVLISLDKAATKNYVDGSDPGGNASSISTLDGNADPLRQVLK